MAAVLRGERLYNGRRGGIELGSVRVLEGPPLTIQMGYCVF